MKLMVSLLLLTLISCKSRFSTVEKQKSRVVENENKNDSTIDKQREMSGYKNWRQDFKDRTFCKCLLAGYGKKQIIDSIYEVDKTYFDPIAITLFDNKIDSILQTEVLKMRKDSLESLTTISEAAAGKRVFGHCLDLYKSKRLDSIVNLEAKKWEQARNLDSMIQAAIPSF